jgi:MerR family transcriptional regulator, light-induced transcriptional regulator
MRYPMKVVMHKTGLPAETLRAWERRYQGITPDRDSRGRRVYSPDMMERLILLSILVDQGFRIGDVADEPQEDLRSMVETVSRPKPQDIQPVPSLEAATQAVCAFDAQKLRAELERATTTYGRLDVIDAFVFPLTHEIARLRDLSRAKDVHLTFLRTSLRTFLSALLIPVPGEAKLPTVVLAHPAGQYCDLGGIATAVHCHAAGWHPVILGGPVCAEEVVEAAHAVCAAAVVIAAVSDRYDPTILAEMSRVRATTAMHIPVYFGGRMPEGLVRDVEASGLKPLKDMNAVCEEFKRLKEAIPA